MKILQVISYGYVCGGAEKSVLLLKNGLAARGHEVRVVSCDRGEAAERFSDYTFPEISPKGFGKYFKHLWHRQAYQTIAAAIADFQPDIVHFHTMGEVSPSGLFALKGTPAVMTVHGPEEFALSILEGALSPRFFKDGLVRKGNLTLAGRIVWGYHRFLQRPFYLLGMRRLRRLVAPSHFIGEKVKTDRLGLPITQIYNGIPLPPAHPPVVEDRILYVGRLERVKGVEYLLEALALLAKNRTSVTLTIAGDGRDRALLEERVKALGLEGRVDFKGWVDNAQTTRLYGQSAVVAIPSIALENLPTVCMEALAVGRPVVGTNTGGLPEMVEDGRTGKIVGPADAAALAKALAYFLDQKPRDDVAAACTKNAQRFSIDTFLTSIETLYQDVSLKPSRREVLARKKSPAA